MRIEGHLGHSRELNVVALQDTVALPSHDQIAQQQESYGARADGLRMNLHVAI